MLYIQGSLYSFIIVCVCSNCNAITYNGFSQYHFRSVRCRIMTYFFIYSFGWLIYFTKLTYFCRNAESFLILEIRTITCDINYNLCISFMILIPWLISYTLHTICERCIQHYVTIWENENKTEHTIFWFKFSFFRSRYGCLFFTFWQRFNIKFSHISLRKSIS